MILYNTLYDDILVLGYYVFVIFNLIVESELTVGILVQTPVTKFVELII